MSIRPVSSTTNHAHEHLRTSCDPGKSYEPFDGDKFLNLYKTLAVDTRAEAAPKVIPTENREVSWSFLKQPIPLGTDTLSNDCLTKHTLWKQ